MATCISWMASFLEWQLLLSPLRAEAGMGSGFGGAGDPGTGGTPDPICFHTLPMVGCRWREMTRLCVHTHGADGNHIGA